ncbi:MAG: ATP-dependent Clp protease proteolytic subunit [Oligoflexia bacterium]|nr:ATP-dependent Clp protease proteolytic subunit [Oligoflexia bacterium]
MKKNPFIILLGVSSVFFILFLAFVFLTMGKLVKNKTILAGSGVNIGVVRIKGAIMDSQKALKDLKELEEDSSVKAVIVRIDSPGGAVGPSQEIHDALKRVKKVKPVIASFESVAASGGYYIAVGLIELLESRNINWFYWCNYGFCKPTGTL